VQPQTRQNHIAGQPAGVGKRSQLHKPHAVSELPHQGVSECQCKTSLTTSAGTGKRKQARFGLHQSLS